jgi:hypothetical protein
MAGKKRTTIVDVGLDREIRQSTKCRVTHTIIIDGQVAFEEGEPVFVDSIEPNPGRPEYRYVITSKRLHFRQFQLRDADLAIFEPEAVPVSKFRKAWWWVGDHKFLLIGSAVAIIVIALGISAFAEYHFKWSRARGR